MHTYQAETGRSLEGGKCFFTLFNYEDPFISNLVQAIQTQYLKKQQIQ